MAKKDKSGVSEISESGVLSLDQESFNTAVERSTWKNTGGGGSLPAVGDYDATITAIEKRESNGAATKGSPNYWTSLEIEGGDFAGSSLKVFTIAHGSTMQRYLRFLEGVMGITADDIESVNGRPQIPVPTEKALQQYVGKTVRVNVQHSDRRDGSKNADGTPRKNADADFVIGEGAAETAKVSKKSKKDKASKIAE